MKYFPAVCIDDFYSDPNSIREFALKQKFTKPKDGSYPGGRTEEISKINPKLFSEFCENFFSIYYDFDFVHLKWEISTSFQLINNLDDDSNSAKNTGWIHVDSNTLLAGIIYLTPEINVNTGTSLYKLKDESLLDNTPKKRDLYLKGIDENNDYEYHINRHNSAYVETVRFNNIYNRLISFDATTPHGVNSYFSSGEPRLTQVFFVHMLDSISRPPLSRRIRPITT